MPASNGATVGVIESKNGGKTLDYVENGDVINVAIPMATAASASDNSVVVGGFLGAGFSLDAGVTWQPLGGIPEVITQDVKYQSGSGLYSVTGVFLNKPAVAVSASASTNFSVIEV